MPIPIWAGHYIGLPFKGHGRDRSGLDCWGLVRLVLSEQFGHALPSFIHEYDHFASGRDRIGALVVREAQEWQSVCAAHVRAGDVIVLRMRGLPLHVGVILDDAHMLHIEQGIDSAIEKYTGARWSSRIYGFYRYKTISNGTDHDFFA